MSDINEEDVKRVFKEFDIDGNGYIEKGEIEKVCELLGVEPSQKEIQDLIDQADTDHDGKISYKEFHKAITGA